MAFNLSVIAQELNSAIAKANAAAPQATTYTKPEVDAALDSKADATDIPAVPITAIQKNGTDITPVSGTVNITVPTTAADISALPDTIKYAAALSLTINSSTFVMTGQLKDQNGDNLGAAQTIDLPLESVVVGGAYNSQTNKVVLTLQNGNTIEFSVADLVSGLQTELSASNKLNPAYINYDSTHRAVSDTEKSTWNGKQSALTTAQLAAVNSGITAERLEAIDTTLAAKLNTSDVDAALSSTSTNPVQNKAVQAPVARLVDAGAKNLLYIHDQNVEAQGISYVVKDGIVSASGTATGTPSSRANLNSVLLPPGEYIFSGCPANGSDTTYRVDLYTSTDDTNYTLDNNMIDRGTGAAFTISTQMYVRPTIRFQNGYVAINLAFKPMICTAEDYAISPEFVPYTPTMREMYEMILAMQNGG